MRLIGTLETEKQAFAFYSFLLKEGIQNTYDLQTDAKTGLKYYQIWVCEEDDQSKAAEWMERYKKNPEEPQFQGFDAPIQKAPPPPKYAEISESENLKWKTKPSRSVRLRRFPNTITNLIIILCSFLFLWNDFQEAQIVQEKGELAEEIAMTPLDKDLFFDNPSSNKYIEELIDTVPLSSYKELKDLPPEAISLLKKSERAPSWRGLYAFFLSVKNQGWETASSVPMFEKIHQGQVWRFFSPCLMHANFLHILFNMIWVWILSSQIEQRMRKWKLCALILIIGIISNTVQYFASGPYFLGFSGVIVGMAGFIWMRQKKAPWEGYPLQKATLLFLLFFVLAMFAIELFTFGLQVFSVVQLTPPIANTAHIVGGLVGILLGRLSFFQRGSP